MDIIFNYIQNNDTVLIIFDDFQNSYYYIFYYISDGADGCGIDRIKLGEEEIEERDDISENIDGWCSNGAVGCRCEFDRAVLDEEMIDKKRDDKSENIDGWCSGRAVDCRCKFDWAILGE